MSVNIIYSEEVQEKIDKFTNILNEYNQALWNHLTEKYEELAKTYPSAANSHINEDYRYDNGRKLIEYQIRKIKELSIPEGITFNFEKRNN